jgi:hypothetical protein
MNWFDMLITACQTSSEIVQKKKKEKKKKKNNNNNLDHSHGPGIVMVDCRSSILQHAVYSMAI